MTMHLTRGTRWLGYAGLLPPAGCLALIAARDPDWSAIAAFWALGYAGIILSFLGGIWWGFAMRRTAGQAALAALSVMPSLAAFFVMIATAHALNTGYPAEYCYLAAAVLLAAALVATLAVDRRLESAGEAPPGWTRFRATLSLGLGGLTLLAGLTAFATMRTVTLV